MSLLFPQNKRPATLKLAALAAALLLLGQSACFNPAFVNQLSGGSVVPIAPGDTPFVHALIINATESSTLNFQFGWTPDFQGNNTSFIQGVAPRQQRGVLLGCPIDQIGLGDPNDLAAPAVVVTTANDVVINVPAAAFPLVLRQGVDYQCGDTVVFTVIDDPNNGYGIQILPGRVDGRTQTGPFTGPDTYEIVRGLLLTAGTPATPVP